MPLASLADTSRRTEIGRRLASFPPNAKRNWGILTPGGAVCHLALSYQMVVDNLPCTERTGWLERSVLRYGALHVSLRWPRSVPTLPELVEGMPGVQPAVFAQDLARLLRQYNRFLDAPSVSGRVHPIFGPLTHWEWMRWGYLHADHHLRQFGL